MLNQIQIQTCNPGLCRSPLFQVKSRLTGLWLMVDWGWLMNPNIYRFFNRRTWHIWRLSSFFSSLSRSFRKRLSFLFSRHFAVSILFFSRPSLVFNFFCLRSRRLRARSSFHSGSFFFFSYLAFSSVAFRLSLSTSSSVRSYSYVIKEIHIY